MSFNVQSHRAGDESNQNGKTDARLIALNTLLVPTLSTASDEKLVEELTQVLTTAYGAPSVSSAVASPAYLWNWDVANQVWTYTCFSETTLTVIDGQQQPVKVQITISQAVA